MSSGEATKTTAYQVEHIGTNTATHQSPAEKGIETQSTAGGQQHGQEKKAA
jgi:hypothetical protein